MKPERFPLSWPEGYPVTEYREQSKFKCTFAEARNGVFAELDRLGATDVLISTNIPRNKKGELVEGKLVYNNPGVAVYFKYKGEDKVLASDKWKFVHENMRAIEKSIEAIRGLERWGCSDIIARAMGDMKALPAGSGIVLGKIKRHWREVLHAGTFARIEDVKQWFRFYSKKYHPDIGSEPDAEKFQEVQEAYKEALNECT